MPIEKAENENILILCAITVLGLLSGCAWSGKHTGATDYNDQNLLTGGPVVGMTIRDLPQTVKDTLQRNVSTAEISNIKRENMSGKSVYKIDSLDSYSFALGCEDGRESTG